MSAVNIYFIRVSS